MTSPADSFLSLNPGAFIDTDGRRYWTEEQVRKAVAQLESWHRAEVCDMAERFRAVNVEKAMEQLASSLPRTPPPGWPDPLESHQAEAIRNGKIDMAEIVDLFDAMEREIRVHRATFCETESRTHTPSPPELVVANEVAGEAEHAKPPCHQAEHLCDEPPLTMSTAAGVSLASPAAPAELVMGSDDEIINTIAHEITGAVARVCCHRTGGYNNDPNCDCRDIATRLLEGFPAIASVIRATLSITSEDQP